ncbi:MAG: response regulator [Paracoccus sp. (in: a-proteobacteria)]|uniref:response regulator n=1 Tax=Paracoccus sp. TaxID=267 RepID=UPI002E8AFB52|nr:response regulator [Pseudomonadota bacterium]
MNDKAPPLSILVVEDELIIAMDIEMMIEDAGHQPVATCTSLDDIKALSAAAAPDLALVDMNLAGGSNGLEASAEIRARWPDTAIIFVTANPKKVPEGCDGAIGVIGKPFSATGFAAALQYIQQLLRGTADDQSVPAGFSPVPRVA